ncbi:GNAT family N-acetyltransferase [Allorhizocola rhizosphaerae]|uniref:GNAT family N-acetyltransferase n=1 Tax=Allorhizocola rhizosphaerae TaxID=1872709 RepID=UPI000E3E50BB|nr:GNAT family N-acetyltransferase [Allorhizocola rhizosphaerae]
MTLSIVQSSHLDPDSIKATIKVSEAAAGHDLPGFPQLTERMAHGWHKYGWVGRRVEGYVAYLDGEPVARMELNFPTLENLNNISVHIEVVPAMRRRGIGRALYEKALERARANDRGHLLTNTVWALPGIQAHDGGAGPAFVQALGLQSANLPEVMRRFDLSTLDNAKLDALLEAAKAKASGYRLVQWKDTAPEEYVDDIAYLDSRLIEDAPMGDVVMEPEKVDAQRVREIERVAMARGRTSYHTGVVHEESDALVAWTTLATDDLDWHGWQQITIVEPRHRGHRLGALVKVENLRYFLAHEPSVRVIDTFNAAENSYMISINEEMGFRPLFAFQNWQREL